MYVPIELLFAIALAVVAVGAGLWLRHSRQADRAPSAEMPWRDVAIDAHLEQRELRRAVADALAVPGAVRGPARSRLNGALSGTPAPAAGVAPRIPEQRRPSSAPLQPLEKPVTVIHQVGPGYLSGPESRTGTDVRL